MASHAPDGARRVIDHLGLDPHPEGGWFRRTWTSTQVDDRGRSAGSSILYLLESGVRSRWHRIDAAESWQLVAGAPLRLSWWRGEGAVHHATLGPDLLDGESPQVVIEPGVWQSATSTGGWSLVVCVVAPEFREEGFEMAPVGWEPGGAAGRSYGSSSG